jgi:two-component sensor histidine kinase
MDGWPTRMRAWAADELERLRRRPWRAALVGLVLVALAVLGRLAMGHRIDLPYVTMFPAVVISAYVGSWRLGVVVAALCALAAAWLFMPFGGTIGRLPPIDLAGLSAFLVTSAILIVVGDFAAHQSLENLRLARQRQTLLAELQHRIKNHLQLMGAMLAFHARAATNERIKARLEEAGRRLQVIAASYDNLYEPGARIDMRDHLRRLCDFVEKGLAADAHIALEAADVRWSLDTVIPLSLIANELLTNAVKHLPEGGTLDVEVRLERAGEHMRLSVASNGSSLPEGFKVEGSGLGLRLAGVLARQLGGTLSAPQPPRAFFIVDFPEPRAGAA